MSIPPQFPRRSVVVGAALAVIGLTGCGIGLARSRELPEGEKHVDGGLRTDLEPLVERFSLLAGATAATWVGGTLGDAGTPGPSLYWIDAWVTLDEPTWGELRALVGTRTGDLEGDLHPLLHDVVAGHGGLHSDELDERLSHGEWRATGDLDPGGPHLLLRAWSV